MEQQDSLRSELQNLSKLQLEQVNILRDMKASDDMNRTMESTSLNPQNIQFNSPSMYANASPMYSNYTNSSPFTPQYISPYAQHMSDNFKTSVAGLAGNKSNYGLLNIVSPTSSTSQVSRTLMSMDYGSRLSQATVAGIGAGASAVSSFGIGALLPGIAGIGTGIVGGAVAGVYTGIANDEIQKNNALKKYLYKNSGLFIDAFESNNKRGAQGFSMEESSDAADFIRKMNDDFYMEDDDTMMLLQKFTEGGLLKDSKDLDSFKDKMSSLTKTVKEGALILNETYDSIADLMSEMRKAGIDQKDFKSLMSKGSVLGGLTGDSASEMVRKMTEFIASLNSGTPNDSNKSIARLEDTTAYMSQYYNSLKERYDKNPNSLTVSENENFNMVKNLGGATEASQYMMATMEQMTEQQPFADSALYYFDWDAEQKDFVFNNEAFKDYKENNYTKTESADFAKEKLATYTQQGQGDAIMKWNSKNISTYMKNSMTDGDISDAINETVDSYVNDPTMKRQGFDSRTILSQYFGVDDTGVQNLLTGFFDFKDANPNLGRDVKIKAMWQDSISEQLAQSPSITERVSSWWDKTKDKSTQWAVDLDNSLGERIQDFTDKLSGVDKITANYDTIFTTSSNMKSISYDEIVNNTNQTNDLMISSLESFKKLQEKGYSMNSDIIDYVGEKFKNSDKQVVYNRDVISDWTSVSKDISDKKDIIIDTAKKNDLSEIIVSALLKYNTERPDDKKIDISATSKKLGDEVFNYGGNYGAALAVTLGADKTKVDGTLNSLGYNMESLRSIGAQEAVQNISVDALGLDEEILAEIKNILNKNITDTATTAATTVPPETISTETLINQDLRNKSNLTAEQINKFIESRTDSSSLMRNTGDVFLKASEESGLDAAYLVTHAGLETGWGSSNILNGKNNWFGIGAYDNSPYQSAYGYSNLEAGIIEGSKFISENYTNSAEFQQYTLNKMVNDKFLWHNYATDPEWDKKNAKIMNELLTETGAGYNGVSNQNNANGNVATNTETITKNYDRTEVNNTEDLAARFTREYDRLKGTDNYNEVSDVVNEFKKIKLNKPIDFDDQYESVEFVNEEDSIKAEKIKMEKNKTDRTDEVAFDTLTKYLNKNLPSDKNIDKSLYYDEDGTYDYVGMKKNVKAQAAEYYSEQYNSLQGFMNGDKEGKWGSMSMADKTGALELMKTLESFIPEIKANLQLSVDDLLKNNDSTVIYTEQEKKDIQHITSDGTYAGGVKNKDVTYDEYKEFLFGSNKETVDSKKEVEQYIAVQEGFESSVGNVVVDKMDKALKTMNLVNSHSDDSAVNITSEERLSKITNEMGTLAKDGLIKIQKSGFGSGGTSGFGSGERGYELNAKTLNSYLDELNTALVDGDYNTVEEALEGNEVLKSLKNKVVKTFNNNETGEKYVADLEGKEYINATADRRSDGDKDKRLSNEKMNMLKTFGSAYANINLSDYDGNVTKYNQALNSAAESFYDNGMKSVKAFISGDTGSEDYKRYTSMTTAERNDSIKMLESVSVALGIDEDDKESIFKIQDEHGENSLYTDDDNLKRKHIVKDNSGKMMYDSSSEANDNNTWDDFKEWRNQGEKKDKISGVESAFKALRHNANEDEVLDGSTDTVSAMKKKIGDQIDSIINENNEAVKNVDTIATSIRDNKSEDLTGLKEEVRKSFASALENGDVETLKTIQANNKDSISDETLEKYTKLAETISNVDISGFTKLVTALEEINKQAEDIGKTALVLNNEMGEGFQKELDTQISNTVKATFDGDTDLGKIFRDSSNGLTSEDISNLLINGGVINEGQKNEVKLSADDIQALSIAMGDAIEQSMKVSLSTQEGVSEFESSSTYKEIAKSDNGKTLTDAVDQLKAVQVKLEDGGLELDETSKEELEAQQNELVTSVTKIYEESLKSLTDTQDGASTAIDAAAKAAEETAKTFETTMGKYDSSIKGAITTMNNRISELSGQQTPAQKVFNAVTSVIRTFN